MVHNSILLFTTLSGWMVLDIMQKSKYIVATNRAMRKKKKKKTLTLVPQNLPFLAHCDCTTTLLESKILGIGT
jgi:hypothetical protein